MLNEYVGYRTISIHKMLISHASSRALFAYIKLYNNITNMCLLFLCY